MNRTFAATVVAGLMAVVATAPAEAAPKRCDPLGGGECLLPFPNDYFTKRDGRTETGRRLALPRAGMPANKDGVRIDPRDWNRADGFSPGQQITVFVPGLNTKRAARRNKLVPITDIARSLDRRQRVVLIDAQTGERQLIWAEVDSAAPRASRRALLIRPAENLAEGRRYVVALRNLRTADGKRIKPSFAFRVMRDAKATRSKSIERRRKAMRRVWPALKRAGIARGNLVLAWDFTVASAESTAGDMLRMRDAAFAQLGDTDLADLVPEGRSPAFTVVKNESAPPEDTEIARVVEGTVAVPCFLESDGCAVGARINRDDDGRPAQRTGNTFSAFFRCVIPKGLPAAGGRALLYGHGLLGRPLDSGDSAQGQLKTLAAQKGFTVCGTYWSGLSAANGDEDTLQAAAAIQDLSRFGQITDRLQQGMLNALFLGRAMVAGDGLRSHPAFAGAFDATQRLYYDGNSQGGISGGALTAVAPDFDRAVLGVPGMNYSTLLSRSVDFTPFRTVLDASYTDPLERSLIYSLLTNLWDRGEANGYAHHMTSDPLPDTPRHEVLLHVALGDHQVAPVTAEVEARTIGARVWNRLDPGRSADVDPVPRHPGPDGVPVLRLGADRLRRGPAHAGEPAGHAGAADGQRPADGGPGPARVPAPHPGGAGHEGPVPAHRREAGDRALCGRGLPCQRVDGALARA